MIDPFTILMTCGFLLGLAIALAVGLSGGAEHAALSQIEGERWARIHARWSALGEPERCDCPLCSRRPLRGIGTATKQGQES